MKIKPIAAVLVSFTLLLGGPIGAAVAHSFTDQTSLTLSVSDRNVERGDTVSFYGHLRARHHLCEANRIVELYRNGVRVDQTRTNSDGFYRFRRRLTSTATWQVRFGGFVGGTHPHSHTCLRSSSNRIKVHVRHH